MSPFRLPWALSFALDSVLRCMLSYFDIRPVLWLGDRWKHCFLAHAWPFRLCWTILIALGEFVYLGPFDLLRAVSFALGPFCRLGFLFRVASSAFLHFLSFLVGGSLGSFSHSARN